MSSIANLPILTPLPSPLLISMDRPTERGVDRSVLVAISPDRETLFTSKKSIDKIRQMLKLRTGPTERHWLYQAKRRTNADFRDATARTSTLIHRVNKADENTPVDASAPVRRVLSTASLNRAPIPMARIDNGIPVGREGNGVTVWGSFVLSTENSLISPRPLGPTHILVVHTRPLSVSKQGKSSLPRRGHDAHFPNMDVPVNDLLLCLSAPNLVTVDGHSPLPHRLHEELPRALLQVPHLETFHEAVVFIHTMNQAEMFRALIPQWMRDLMHPLPIALPVAKDTTSIFSPKKSRGPASLFGILSSTKLASSASSTYSVETSSGISGYSNDIHFVERADAIARDIVESLPFFSDKNPNKDELLHTIATLNALRTNLAFLGYIGKAVWDELETSLDILTRALIQRSAVLGEVLVP
ncbi:hypothetical protein B0H16DRAFT_1432123 [Mycena metata]|uniref:Uncharacterized protein n=1 Tax=Mycena metata TaxID=1033252 RepID=A0AAD7HHT7_9AGAR|nr:hypothetical protein B0H16DRAFT_1432123 [Mycena metata]